MRSRLFGLLAAALLPLLATTAPAAEPPRPLATKVFSVADLVVPIPDIVLDSTLPAAPARKVRSISESGEELLKLVTAMVRPYSWNTQGGAGKAEFLDTGFALVISNTPEVIAEVGDLIEALRRLQDFAIATEVRIIRVPAGFCERHGIDREKGTGLDDTELKKVLEAVQAHREGSVLQFPKITCFNGQTATIRNGEQRMFLTAVEAMRNKGATILVPKNSPIELGDTLTLCGRVSADRKLVKLEANFKHTRLNGEVELVPYTTFITPVFEGGSLGKPIPFTQYLQAPDVKTEKIEKTVVVPDGGTIVLGGWNEDASKPVMRKIPYINRLFKNPGASTETEVIVLATARIVRSEPVEVAPMPRECAASASAVYKLRNIAAADAVKAVGGYLSCNRMQGTLVAEPVTNCVYISAEKAVQNQVVTLLRALDAPPRQVLIQAVVVQVPWGFLSDIGMSDDADRANVLTLTPRELNLFNTQLRKAKNRDIISRPQIVVADNQTGHIRVGQTEHIRAGYEIIAGPKGQTLAFKENPVETGLKLQVTPRIDPKGETVLLRVESSWTKVGANVSAAPLTLPPEITGLPYPLTTDVPSFGSVSTETITTTAKVDFKRTIIVRGLSCKDPGGERGGFAGLAQRAIHGGGEVLILLTPYAVNSASGVGIYGR